MKAFGCCLLALASIPVVAQMSSSMKMDRPAAAIAPAAEEHLGTVDFATSCSPAVRASFDRGVALLHDFWYDEAKRQFQEIATADPGCSMAHWGIAMSDFHQIWNRPDEATSKLAWAELQKAQSPAAKTPRERGYIDALSGFFQPGSEQYPARIDAYAKAMGRLYAKYPDVDTGAFYALALLAASKPDDTSQTQEHQAMAVLTPLFAKYPDNPGVDHYIIHSCDNPAMAADGLAASDHYLEIASSGAHAYHMPGHIYARLGLWPQDIKSQLGSIAAAEASQAKYGSGLMDEPHSYDFVMYAYLQSGQDARAKWALEQSSAVLTRISAMGDMANHHMQGMVPYYRAKYAAFYSLENRDWQAAAALEPAVGSPPEVATLAIWARTIGDGHLQRAAQASADLARYDALIDQIKKGKHAYMAEGTGASITREEIVAWMDFAHGSHDGAIQHMRAAADLQDKVGQGEVDIPAREMLGDMLLESNQPKLALVEYEQSLKLSPNRFNGLYNAGRAAEAAGDKAKAQEFYAALLKSTDNGAETARPELAHVKSFVSSTQVAAK